MIRNGWYIRIEKPTRQAIEKTSYVVWRILPVLIVRGDSRKSESLCIRFEACQPNNVFIIWVRHWEESRPSSRISGLLSCYHMLIGRWWRTHRRMCKRPGIVVGFESEGESETSVRKERSYLCYWVFKLYLLRYGRLNELFVLTILVHPCRFLFYDGADLEWTIANVSNVHLSKWMI